MTGMVIWIVFSASAIVAVYGRAVAARRFMQGYLHGHGIEPWMMDPLMQASRWFWAVP